MELGLHGSWRKQWFRLPWQLKPTLAVVVVVAGCSGSTTHGGVNASSAGDGSGGSAQASAGAQMEGGAQAAIGGGAGDAGMAAWDPHSEFPDSLGPVEGAAAQVPAACCSRRTAASAFCPAGADEVVSGTFTKQGDAVSILDTVATRGVPFGVIALAAPAQAPQPVVLVETTLPPPQGVADGSPVYYVGPPGALPAMASQVPIASNQHSIAQGAAGMYYSVDGKSFSRVADSYLNAGFLQGTLPGAGF